MRPVPTSIVFLTAAVLLCAVVPRLWYSAGSNSHAVLLCVLVLYAALLPALLYFWRISRDNAASPPDIPDLRVIVMTVFAIVTAAFGYTYNNLHTISDESSYVFQARTFAAGKLKADPLPGATANPATTPPEIYFEQQVDTSRGWFSKYPPGWPLVLAIGVVLRCPWLVNPVLGVFLLLLVNRLARPWDRVTQIIAVILVGCSAYSVVYSSGFMSHALAALTAAGSLAAVFHGVRSERLGGIILGFLIAVAGITVRPFTGAVVALLCALYVLYSFRNRLRLLWPSLAIIAVAAMLSAGLFVAVNKIYTGQYLLSPYAYSRGGTKIQELTLDPLVAAHNVATTWRWSLAATLCCAFPFVFPAAAYGCWKERLFRRELICLALLFPLLMIAYCFQSEPSGSFDGERYWYEGYAPLCVAASRGYVLLMRRWRVRPAAVKLGLFLLMGIAAVFIAVVIHDLEARLAPWRMAYRSSVAPPTRPLVFVSGSRPEFTSKHTNWNDPRWETAPILFLNDPGIGRRDEVACRFRRPAYRVIAYDSEARRVAAEDHVAVCPSAGDRK